MPTYDLQALSLGVSEADWDAFKRQHLNLFGHVPAPDLVAKITCTHPMHGEAQQLISAPGVALPVHMDALPRHAETNDDPEIDPRFDLDEWVRRAAEEADAPKEFTDE